MAQDSSFSYLTIPGTFGDLAYDGVSDRIFATDTAFGAVRVINPYTGAVERSLQVGPGVNQLALSSNGEYLYVGVDVPGEIVRMNLRTMVVDQRFEVWRTDTDRWRAGEIIVFPENPDKIAVVVIEPPHLSPGTFIRLFEHGRPGGSTASPFRSDRFIVLNNDGMELYGAASGTLHRFQVIDNELYRRNEILTALDAVAQDLEWANGLLYANSGQVFDATTMTEIACFPSAGEVTLDPSGDRIYFRNGGRFDGYLLSTREPAGTIAIPGLTNVFGESVQFGASGLAFLTESQLVLTTSDVISGNPYSGVLQNDRILDRRPLTAVLFEPPQHGTLTMNPDGTFVYQPKPNYFGEDTFTYKVRDGQCESGTAKVTIRVNPVDDPPATTPDHYYYVGDPIRVAPSKGVLANDLEPDGATLNALVVQGPQHGELQFNEDGSFSYTAGPMFTGNDRFTYRATDGVSRSAETVVTIASPLSLVADDVSLAVPPSSAAEGFFNVYLRLAPGFEFSTVGYEVLLRTPPGSGVTLVEAGATTLPRHLFAEAPVSQAAPQSLHVAYSSAAGFARIDDGEGLVSSPIYSFPGIRGRGSSAVGCRGDEPD